MSLMGEEEKKTRVLAIAMGEGIKYGLLASAVVGAATVFAHNKYKGFNKFLSISAKTSFPLMAGVAGFTIKYEVTMTSAQRHPELWGLTEYVEKGKVTKSSMPFHHKVLNAMYDRPYHIIAGAGVPFAGFILYEQMKLTHLTISQRIMHSRVIAQMGILGILLSTMAFKEYMDKNGRFPEPEEEEDK